MHNTEDKKEKKVITKADEEKKNKTRENMLAKLKLTKKKDALKIKIITLKDSKIKLYFMQIIKIFIIIITIIKLKKMKP